jgi:hypothetical protein
MKRKERLYGCIAVIEWHGQTEFVRIVVQTFKAGSIWRIVPHIQAIEPVFHTGHAVSISCRYGRCRMGNGHGG